MAREPKSAPKSATGWSCRLWAVALACPTLLWGLIWVVVLICWKQGPRLEAAEHDLSEVVATLPKIQASNQGFDKTLKALSEAVQTSFKQEEQLIKQVTDGFKRQDKQIAELQKSVAELQRQALAELKSQGTSSQEISKREAVLLGELQHGAQEARNQTNQSFEKHFSSLEKVLTTLRLNLHQDVSSETKGIQERIEGMGRVLDMAVAHLAPTNAPKQGGYRHSEDARSRSAIQEFWTAKKNLLGDSDKHEGPGAFKKWADSGSASEVQDIKRVVPDAVEALLAPWRQPVPQPGDLPAIAARPKVATCHSSELVRRYGAKELQGIEDHARGIYGSIWDLYMLVRDTDLVPHHHVFSPWAPVPIESGCPLLVGGLTHLGGEDETDAGKSLCGFDVLTNEGPECIVISMGSKNAFAFEEAILNRTSCRIEVFDCFVENPTPPKTDRLRFHQECITGEKWPGKPIPAKYTTIPSLLSRHGLGKISLLKMDIEGYERSVFQEAAREWWASGGVIQWLPQQILLELHCCDPNMRVDMDEDEYKAMDQAETLLLLQALMDMGYRVVAKEVNMYGKAIEVTLVRFLC